MTALLHPPPTPLDRSGMQTALASGHVAVFGDLPSLPCLTMALAMCCLEHANGHALYGWDFGNLAATPEWTGDTYPLRQREIIRSEEVYLTKLMRSYPTAEEGAAGYWALLSEPRFAWRGKHAFVYFDAGDPLGSSFALKNGAWFTATVTSYADQMTPLYAECLKIT